MRDAYSVVECCEWLPAVLTGVRHSGDIARSRCAYGHKLMWNEEWGGLPPEEFFRGLDQRLAALRMNMPDESFTADKPVGTCVRNGPTGLDSRLMLSSLEVLSIVMSVPSVQESGNIL